MATARSTDSAVSFADKSTKNTTSKDATGTENEQRTKFLTMKYGQNEIKLIQKRLKIEFWIDAQLKQLYEVDENSVETYPCDVDLDEVLDMDDTEERRQFLIDTLQDCPQPVESFVDEVLEKLETL